MKLLNLSQNALEELPPSLFDGLNLSVIDLSHNNLRKLDSQLFDLENLTSLDVSHNKLQALPPKVFQSGVSKLEILDLAENELSTLPALFFCCNLSIRSLKLEGNRLQRLHSGDFRGLSCLEELNLQQNQLANLDADVFDDHNLKRSLLKLNLGGNRITTLPNGLFNGFRKLRNLQLQSNQLVRLPQQLFQTLGEAHWAFLEFLKSMIVWFNNYIYKNIYIYNI